MLYAFFRLADDVVDDPDPPPPDVQRATLRRMRREALGRQETTDPVLGAFSDIREQYDIPDREVNEFIAAMEQDIFPERYETYEDLEAYLRGSSVAVAYMMVAIMELENPEMARPHAKPSARRSSSRIFSGMSERTYLSTDVSICLVRHSNATA